MPFVCCIWMFFLFVCFFPTAKEPNFVGSYDIGDYVYFFFRETAVEYINCGKNVYSRVARVCKKDNGGKNILSQNWATFLKARLNCSIPGEFPFYFNEIRTWCVLFLFFFLVFPFVSLVLLNSFWNSLFFCRPFVCVCVRDEVGNRLVGTCFHGNEAIDLFWTARTFFF